MYITKLVVVILIWLCSSGNGFTQEVDTVRLLNSAKMRLMKYALPSVYPEEALQAYIKYQSPFKELKSDGFDTNRFLFFSIEGEEYIDLSDSIQFEDGIVGYYNFFPNLNYSFVFAYDKLLDRLYLLNSDLNDFRDFYYLYFNRGVRFKKAYIEKLDMNCALKQLKSNCSSCMHVEPIYYDGLIW